MQPVFRFAPSPNGRLHLGHAFAALTGYDLCHRAGGRFLLRIEDIDPGRSRPAFEEAIYEDLTWLGLRWETPVRRQSEHMDVYRAALARLTDHALLYPAFLSRREVAAATAAPGWPRDPDGAPHYPDRDRNLKPADARALLDRDAPHTLRLRMDKAVAASGSFAWLESGAGPKGETGTIAAKPAAWSDVVLARRDVPTSYHLAVVVDDAIQGITHVVRGQDLFHATSVHVLLQRLLGYSTPNYHHHRLISDEAGRKLSKQVGDTSLAELRQRGLTADDIRTMVGL